MNKQKDWWTDGWMRVRWVWVGVAANSHRSRSDVLDHVEFTLAGLKSDTGGGCYLNVNTSS